MSLLPEMLTKGALVDDAAWSGIAVTNLTGTDNVVGATRQIDVSSNGAGFTLTEQVCSNIPDKPHVLDSMAQN